MMSSSEDAPSLGRPSASRWGIYFRSLLIGYLGTASTRSAASLGACGTHFRCERFPRAIELDEQAPDHSTFSSFSHASG